MAAPAGGQSAVAATVAQLGPAAAATAPPTPLNIGDAVVLYVQADHLQPGFLFSSSSFRPGVYMKPSSSRTDAPNITNIHASVFEVYVPFDYKANKKYQAKKNQVLELEKQAAVLKRRLRELSSSSPGTPTSPGVADATAKLTAELTAVNNRLATANVKKRLYFRAQRVDQANNDKEQRRQAGKPLLFGDIIQLRHVLTNKFVRANTGRTSLLEYSGLAVELQEHSDRSCRFKILPRFKVHNEGDVVSSGDQIVLVNERAQGQYLSLSSQAFGDRLASDSVPRLEARLNRGLYEACVQAQSFTWNIHRFSALRPDEIARDAPLLVRGGDYIILFDREKEGVLMADQLLALTADATAAGRNTTPTPGVFLNCGLDKDGGLQEESKSFWQLELRDSRASGAILAGHSQTVALRNLVLNLYLAVQPSPTAAGTYEPYLASSLADPNTAFQLVPFQSQGQGVQGIEHGSNVSLQHLATKTFLHTTSEEMAKIGAQLAAQQQGVQGGQARKNSNFNVTFHTTASYADVFVIRRVPAEDMDDFNTVQTMLPLLDLLVDYTSPATAAMLPSVQAAPHTLNRAALTGGKAVDALWSADGPRVMRLGVELLEELALFLLDQDDDDFEWGKDVYKRQGLLQDLGVFERLVAMLKQPLTIIVEDARTERTLPEYRSLWTAALRVLLNGASGVYSETDRFIAQSYATFFTHVFALKTPVASDVTLELITDSRDIIDDLLDKSDLGFDWVLKMLDRKSGRGVGGAAAANPLTSIATNINLFKLLAVFCLCQELAVRRAQEKVFHQLFDDDEAFAYGHLFSFHVQRKPGGKTTVSVQLGRQEPIAIAALCEPVIDSHEAPPSTVAMLSTVDEDAEDDDDGMPMSPLPASPMGPTPPTDTMTSQSSSSVLLSTPSVASGLRPITSGLWASPSTTGFVAASGSSNNDRFQYYQPAASHSDEFDLLLAQLQLFASITDGCFTAAENKVKDLLDPDAMLSVVYDKMVAFPLRTCMAKLLFELYFDSSGFAGIPFIDRPQRCFGAGTQIGLGTSAANPANAAAGNVQETSFSLSAASFGADVAKIKHSLHQWLVSNAFRELLSGFFQEMIAIIKTSDEFEPYHLAHGKFLLAILDTIRFLVRYGFYVDAREASQLFDLLVSCAFQFTDSYRTAQTHADAVNDKDLERDKLVESVMSHSLDILALLLKTVHYQRIQCFVSQMSGVCEWVLHEGSKAAANNTDGAVRGAWLARANSGAPFQQPSLNESQRNLVPLCEHALMLTANFDNTPTRGAAAVTAPPRLPKEFVKKHRTKARDFLAKIKEVTSLDAFLGGARESLDNALTAMGGSALDYYSPTYKPNSSASSGAGAGSGTTAGASSSDMHIKLCTLLTRLSTSFGAGPVTTRSAKCLKLLHSGETVLQGIASDLHLIVSPESRHALGVALAIAAKLNDISYDRQIDDEEAKDLQKILADMQLKLMVQGEIPLQAQNVLRHTFIVSDLLALFDQVLDDDDLRASESEKNLQKALVATLDFLALVTRGNGDMQELMFSEMLGLLQNPNTQPPTVSAALARLLMQVFAAPGYRAEVQERHIQLVVALLSKHFKDKSNKRLPTELVQLLEAMSLPHGSTHMTRTHAIITSQIMQHCADLLHDVQGMAQLPPVGDPRRSFYVAVISLLGVLAGGENEFIESVCKRMFSVEALLAHLMENTVASPAAAKLLDRNVSHTDPAVRQATATVGALLGFLNTVHLDAQVCVKMTHSIADARWWRVGEWLAKFLASVADSVVQPSASNNTSAPTPELLGLIDHTADFLHNFYSCNFNSASIALSSPASNPTEGAEGEVSSNLPPAPTSAFTTRAAAAAASTTRAAPAPTLLSQAEVLQHSGSLCQRASAAVTHILLGGNGQPWMASDLLYSLLRGLLSMLAEGNYPRKVDAEATMAHVKQRAAELVELRRGRPTKRAAAGAQRSGGKGQHAANLFAADGTMGGEVDVEDVDAIFDDEQRLNLVFAQMQSLVFNLAFDRNRPFHKCCRWKEKEEERVLEHWDCPYLEGTLPLGAEFQAHVTLLNGNEKLVKTLIDNLRVLAAVLTDTAQGDEAKEAAELALKEACQLLEALVQRQLCCLSQGSLDLTDPSAYAFRDSVWAEVKRAQNWLAELGLVKNLVLLLKQERKVVFQPAWSLLCALCAGGNRTVQEAVYNTLLANPEEDFLTRVRQEIVQTFAVVMQRREALQRLPDPAATENTGGRYIGLTSSSTARGGRVASLLKGGSLAAQLGTVANNAYFGQLQDSFGTLGLNSRERATLLLQNAEVREAKEVKAELDWLIRLYQGVQLLVEGAYTDMQNYLREQEGTSVSSVNFVREACSMLQATHGYITRGSCWLELVDQGFDTLAELCYGCVGNQQEALDEKIVKIINNVIAFDSTNVRDLFDLTCTKRAAMAILEAMLESSDGREMAQGLRSSLNLEEAYLAMNRFYYLHLYVERELQRQKAAGTRDGTALTEEGEDVLELEAETHLQAGFEMFFIFLRLQDLTGLVYRWDRNGRVVDGEPNLLGSAVDKVTSSAQDKRRLEELEEVDKAVLEKLEELLKKDPQKRRDAMGGDDAFAFVEYSRTILSELDQHGGENIGKSPDRWEWFQLKSASIEFLRGNALQQLHFRKPEVEITATHRDEILGSIDRSAPQEKVRSFLKKIPDIRRKLNFQEQLKRHPRFLGLVSEGTSTTWKWISLAVTLVINIYMLVVWDAPGRSSVLRPEVPDSHDFVMYALGGVHLLVSIAVNCEYWLNHGGTMELDVASIFYVLHLAFSLAGLIFRGFFYAFHLLHIVVENDVLQRAIQSITRNGRQLAWVVALSLVIVYMFAMMGFTLFRDEFQSSDGYFCDNLLQCTVSAVYQGIRAGGGLGDTLILPTTTGGDYYWRVLFDMAFYVLISVLAINLVLGIVVDAFSDLRSERAQVDDDMNNSCTICSLPSHLFEALEGGFRKHTKEHHNLWAYAYFVMHLQKLNPFDRTANEEYLFKMLCKNQMDPDISVFPIKRSLQLEQYRARLDDEAARLAVKQEQAKQEMDAKLQDMQATLIAIAARLNVTPE